VDLEVVPKWHASTYHCALLGCFGDVLHISVHDRDPRDVDMELKYIYDDALIIAYLQASEFPIGLILKERLYVCVRPSNSNGKVIPSYEYGQLDK